MHRQSADERRPFYRPLSQTGNDPNPSWSLLGQESFSQQPEFIRG